MALTRLARASALALALAASFELAAAPAFAQRYQDSGGTAVPGFVPITPGVGPQGTTSNPTHVTGSLTASFAGFTQSSSTSFATGTTSASDQNVALPAGTEFIVTNTGANALAYNIGGAATGTMNVLQPNSWVAFANTAAAAFHYIEATGAGGTTFSIVGGAGVPTGAGGGGGSTAGGATAANQTTGNTSAATTATNTGTTATNTSVLNGLGTNGAGNGLTITCTNCSGGGGSGGSGGSTPQTTAGGAINVSTAATTKLITGISGQYTYITAYNLVAAGTTNVSLEYGTTASNPCDTSAVVIDGPVALTAQAGKGQGSGLGTVLPPIPQGKDVCIVNSAAIQVGGSLNYTQSTTLAGSFGGGGSSSPFASNGNYVNLPSVTVTSTNSSLPGGSGTAILMSNYGSNAVMVALSSSGSSTVTAATADDIIPANSTHSLAVGSNTKIAYATITGSSSLQITGGAGQFTGAGGGGGGSGGSFTWPGSAGNGALGAAGSGTAPYVNAYLPDIQTKTLTTVQPAVGAFGAPGPASGAAMGANGPGIFDPVIQAHTTLPINISIAVTTQIVALVASQKIYVTSWDVMAPSGNFTLEYGTGTLCGTGTTALTGPEAMAGGQVGKGVGLGPVLIVPASNALCAVTSAAVQYSGSLSFTQF